MPSSLGLTASSQQPDATAVRQAAVLPREDGPGGKRLVAYVVVPTDVRPTAADLRGFLQGKLPDYMVPSAFVVLEALPLTPNGKLDRAALPEPESAAAPAGAELTGPRDVLELQLQRLWEDLLGVRPIGVEGHMT